MASQIDSSIPHEGKAYTSNVRDNFEIARQEITALQDRATSLETLVAQLQADVAALQAAQPPTTLTHDPVNA
jgi:hypothetical protein